MVSPTKVHPADLPGSITGRQRRRLFALGRRRGMGLDELRGLTPNGSISVLSFRQAEALAERLGRSVRASQSERRRPRQRRAAPAPEGVIRLRTQRQLDLIAELRIRAGLAESQLDSVVERAVGVRGMARLSSRPDASKVISVQWAIVHKAERASSKHPGERRCGAVGTT